MAKTSKRNLRKFVDKGTEFITIEGVEEKQSKNKKAESSPDDKQDGLGYIKI